MRPCDLQVHAGGLRHIRADRRVNEWRAPGRRTITKAATNERQAVIVLSGGELLYFELDAAGQLQVRRRVEHQGLPSGAGSLLMRARDTLVRMRGSGHGALLATSLLQCCRTSVTLCSEDIT